MLNVDKFNTFFWYLRQPGGFGLLWRLLLRATFFKSLERTGFDACQWGESLATGDPAALENLFPGCPTLDDGNFHTDIATRHREDFQFAQSAVDRCSFKMGGEGHLNLLFSLCELTQARRVIETGVAYGWSSLAILLSISQRDGRLVSTDMSYPKMGNSAAVGVAVPPRLRPFWLLIPEPDVVGLPKALKVVSDVDLVHYDSDKSYVGRHYSYPLLYKHLRPGGLFVSDDIQDNLAFKHFCQKINRPPTVVRFRNQLVGIVRK